MEDRSEREAIEFRDTARGKIREKAETNFRTFRLVFYEKELANASRWERSRFVPSVY